MYYTVKSLCDISKQRELPVRIFRNPCNTYYAIVYNFREKYSLVWRSRTFSSFEMIEKHLLNNGMKRINLHFDGVAYV